MEPPMSESSLDLLPSGEIPESAPLQAIENPEFVMVDGERVALAQLLEEYRQLKTSDPKQKDMIHKAVRNYRRERELNPFQAELIHLQNYLIATKRRMVIVFEGRDAAGKGGTIRAVARHMNERHYRVVALGKPTEQEETQWEYEKYVAQFPEGRDIVTFDRSG